MIEKQITEMLETLSSSLAEKVLQKVEAMTKGNSAPEEFLNTAEALKFLKTKSPETLRKWVRAGLIPPPAQVGGRKKMFKKSDLENFLNHGRR